MSYFYKEYDYDTLANDADYIDEYDDCEDETEDLQSWENYYHNVAKEIQDE